VPCEFGSLIPNASIPGGPVDGNQSNMSASTLSTAMAICQSFLDCGGVTESGGVYQVRAGSWVTDDSSSTSWLVSNPGVCRRGAAGAAGLIVGAPEHDWSRDTHNAFYNNNVWSAAGLERLGAYLSANDPSTGTPRNATLGADMLAGGARLRAAVQASIAACSVANPPLNATFVPPYAEVNSTPYTSMYVTCPSQAYGRVCFLLSGG
jgi:hypothetical protein